MVGYCHEEANLIVSQVVTIDSDHSFTSVKYVFTKLNVNLSSPTIRQLTSTPENVGGGF